MPNLSRRSFIQRSALAGGLMALPRVSWASDSPNERINLGVIGLGGRGERLLKEFGQLPGLNVAGICDPDTARQDKQSLLYPDAKSYTDLRILLDNKSIDAVVISACNHWHSLAALWALEAGKHVYVEKPLCNAHWEGQQLVKAAASSDKICQFGTQQRTAPMQTEIKKLIHDEQVIGEPKWIRVNRYGVRQSIGKRDEPLTIPSTVDYNLWLGPASDQAIYRDKLHYDWHWDWNTGGGEMGNWGVHLLDDVRNNAFQDRIPFPKRIVTAGGRFGWDDAGNTPNTQLTVLDTGEIPVVFTLTNLPSELAGDQPPECPGFSSGYVVYCEGGRLESKRGQARLVDNDGIVIKEIPGTDGMGLHQQNFLDAIRKDSKSEINAPVEVGHHSTAWCNLANYAYRVSEEHPQSESKSWEETLEPMQLSGVTSKQVQELCDELTHVASLHEEDSNSAILRTGPVLHFDSESESFIGEHSEAANQHLRTTGRGEFVVPEVTASATAVTSAS